jgi:hypothetical protein
MPSQASKYDQLIEQNINRQISTRDLVRSLFGDVDRRLTSVEASQSGVEEARQTLIQLGLSNLSEVLGPVRDSLNDTLNNAAQKLALLLVPTKAAFEAMVVPNDVDVVRLLGFDTAGDGRGGAYLRQEGEPDISESEKIQVADGSWWKAIPTNELILPTGCTAKRRIADRAADVVSLMDESGVVGDGVHDDTDGIVAALARHGSVRKIVGHDRIYAVSSNIELPDNCELEGMTFKQIDPGFDGRRTLFKTSGAGSLTLRGVRVNRNGAPTDGSYLDAAGIWLANQSNVLLEDVEVYGDSLGTGILLVNCNDVQVRRPYVHDMRWSAAMDPGQEQIVGIWINTCVGVDIDSPRVARLSGVIAGSPRDYQTDGISISQSQNVSIWGGEIRNVGEGTDVSGSGENRNIWIFGTRYRDIDSWGQKWAHDVKQSGSSGCRASNSGLAGWVVQGGTVDDSAGADIRIDNFLVLDSGTNGHWESSVGGCVIDGGDATKKPKVVASHCQAIDTGGATMKYGFRNEYADGASLRLIDHYVSGATIAELNGIGSGYVRLLESGYEVQASMSIGSVGRSLVASMANGEVSELRRRYDDNSLVKSFALVNYGIDSVGQGVSLDIEGGIGGALTYRLGRLAWISTGDWQSVANSSSKAVLSVCVAGNFYRDRLVCDVEVNQSVVPLQLNSYAASDLPSKDGAIAYVVDANSKTVGVTVAGGGAFKVLAMCFAGTWRIIAAEP